MELSSANTYCDFYVLCLPVSESAYSTQLEQESVRKGEVH